MTAKAKLINDAIIAMIEAIPAAVLEQQGGYITSFKNIASINPNEDYSLGAASDRLFDVASGSAAPAQIITQGYEYVRQLKITVQYVVLADYVSTEARAQSDGLPLVQVLRNPGAWTGGAPSGLRSCRWLGSDPPTGNPDGTISVVHNVEIQYGEN